MICTRGSSDGELEETGETKMKYLANDVLLGWRSSKRGAHQQFTRRLAVNAT